MNAAEALSSAALEMGPPEKPTPATLSISVATSAIEAIATHLKKRGTPDASLRVGIRGGGCSGFSYVIEFHDGAPRGRDNVYRFNAADGTAVQVLCDPKSLVYLNGATLEFEKTLMRQGFKWTNPQEKSNCGCGTSFSV